MENPTYTIDDYIKISPLIEAGPYRDSLQNLTEHFRKARLERAVASVKNVHSARNVSARRASKTAGSGTLSVGQALNKSFPNYSEFFGKAVYAFVNQEGWDDSTEQIFGIFGAINMMNTAAYQLPIDPNEVRNHPNSPTTHERVMEALTGDARPKLDFSGNPKPGEMIGGKIKIQVSNPQQVFHLNMSRPPSSFGGLPTIEKELKTAAHELTHVLTAEAGTRDETLLAKVGQSADGLITPDREAHIKQVKDKVWDLRTRHYKLENKLGGGSSPRDLQYYEKWRKLESRVANRLSRSVDPKLKLSINSPEIQQLLQDARTYMGEKVIEEVTAEVGGTVISLRSMGPESLVQNINDVVDVGYYTPDSWSGYMSNVITPIKTKLKSLAEAGLLLDENGKQFTIETAPGSIRDSLDLLMEQVFEKPLADFSGAAFAVGMEDSILALPDTMDGVSLKQFKQSYLRKNS